MRGTIAEFGMAYARTFIINEQTIMVEKTYVVDVQSELQRFHTVKMDCERQLEAIIDGLVQNNVSDTADILDFQLLMLSDTDYIGKIENAITSGNCNSEYAIETVSKGYVDDLQKLTDNDYLKERALDVLDLSQRLINNLLGVETIVEPSHDYIIIAEDLAPSRLAEMDSQKIKGIVLEKGGITSHCAIIAKSLGIPCMIGTKGILDTVQPGEHILLDAISGEVVTGPSEQQIEQFEEYQQKRQARQHELNEYINKKSITKDGFEMKVFANIISDMETAKLLEQGGEGVGLFRTELLYMAETSAPSEDKQYIVYKEAANSLGERPLIIRTLDVGGDKEIPYLGIDKESNPFLGFRAIRYCLNHETLFSDQISAILRASVNKNVSMMLPMITNIDEVRASKRIVEEVKQRLREKAIPFDEDMKIGIMIETPAAAIDCEYLAKEVDFFSIGTNDLTQYLFVADRTNDKVSYLNSHFQPTLIRTINHVAKIAHKAGIEVDICGQAGEVPQLVPLWIAMGIDNVSVSVPSITKIRRIICESNKTECDALLQTVLKQEASGNVETMLNTFYEEGQHDNKRA